MGIYLIQIIRKVSTKYQGRYFNKGEISLSFGGFKNAFGARNFYHPKFYFQTEEVGSSVFSLKQIYNFNKILSSVLIASQRTHDDLFDFDDYRKKNRINSVNFHKTTVQDLEYKLRFSSDLGKTALGINYRSEKVISNRLGTKLPEPIKVDNYAAVNYSLGKIRDNFSFFTEHAYTAGKFSLNAGAMINRNSSFGTTLYPGFDLNYDLGNRKTVYINANRSLRYPTFTELYLNTSTLKADPLLLPEKAWTYEMGFKWLTPKHNLVSSLFYKSTQDAIDKISKPNVTVPFMVNIDAINLLGFEVQDQMSLNLGPKSFKIKRLTAGYAFLAADKKEEGFQSYYLLNFLRHKATLGLNTQVLDKLNLDIWYTAKDRLGEFQLDAASPLLPYKPVYLLDIRLSLQKKYFTVYLDGSNVLNHEYEEFGFVKQPGRWINSGLKINL